MTERDEGERNALSRRRFLVLMGLGGSASILAACQQSIPAASGAASATAVAAPASPTPSTAAIAYAIAGDPVSLDPGAEGSETQKTAIRTMFDSLTYLTPDGKLEPALATEWSASADGLKWTFRLRRGVKFHDGDPVDASAVKFSIDRVLDPKSSLAGRRFVEPIVKSVAAVGDDVVELSLTGAFAAVPYLASQVSFGVVSPKAAKALGADFARKPVGCGPFVFKEWKSGQQIVVERNETYWGGRALPQRVTFQVVPEPSTRMALLDTGGVDLVQDIPAVEAKRVKNDARLTLLTANVLEVRGLRINMLDDRLKDVRVRQALNYAVNVQEIVDTIFAGLGKVATGPMPTGVPGSLPTRKYRYDPAMAKTLLAQAGYASGFSTVLAYRDAPEAMQAIQAQLKAVGIDAKLTVLDTTAYAAYNALQPSTPAAKAKGLTHHGSTFRYPDPNFLFDQFHSGRVPPNGSNYGYYANAKVDDLLQKGQVEPEPTKRASLYKDVQDALVDDPANVYLWEQSYAYASRGLKGVVLSPTGEISFLRVSKG